MYEKHNFTELGVIVMKWWNELVKWLKGLEWWILILIGIVIGFIID
jgi:hypothetical protein